MEILYVNDIFEIIKPGDILGITTNGIIKSNGSLVMGKGIAGDINKLTHYKISEYLGEQVLKQGNVPIYAGTYRGIHLISFPTKYDWKEASDINLIQESARLFKGLVEDLRTKGCKVYLPIPGCNNGRLSKDVVIPKIEGILGDSCILIGRKID